MDTQQARKAPQEAKETKESKDEKDARLFSARTHIVSLRLARTPPSTHSTRLARTPLPTPLHISPLASHSLSCAVS